MADKRLRLHMHIGLFWAWLKSQTKIGFFFGPKLTLYKNKNNNFSIICKIHILAMFSQDQQAGMQSVFSMKLVLFQRVFRHQ